MSASRMGSIGLLVVAAFLEIGGCLCTWLRHGGPLAGIRLGTERLADGSLAQRRVEMAIVFRWPPSP